MNKPKRDNPVWETVVLAASFLLLWVWFLARQVAMQTPDGRLSPAWQIPLGIALLVLVIVTIRRMIRVRRAFSRQDEDANGYPPRFPPNGHTKK